MTIPSILLGILVSTLLGAGFHVWLGGSLLKLIIFVISSWVGFWSGHFLGNILDFSILKIGPLNLGWGVLVTLMFLSIIQWLSQPAKNPE